MLLLEFKLNLSLHHGDRAHFWTDLGAACTMCVSSRLVNSNLIKAGRLLCHTHTASQLAMQTLALNRLAAFHSHVCLR